MSCKLEPAIWSRGTGQRIACFDRCQLIIAGMSNIKEVHGKLRLYVSFLEYGRHVGQHRRPRRRTYASTSNTVSQDDHEKINSWVSFIFPLHDEYGAPLGSPLGRRSSATTNMRVYLKQGSNIRTSKEMVDAIQSSGGVARVHATLCRSLQNKKTLFKCEDPKREFHF